MTGLPPNPMHTLGRDRRGVAAVEMALVATVLLLPLCAFTTEVGQALLTQYRLSRALHAGLMYAWGAPTSATVTTIQSAASAGFQTNGGTGPYESAVMTPVASILYYCIDPTVGTHGASTVASSTSTCPNGQVVGTWVNLSLSATIPTIFVNYKGSASWPLTIAGTVRIS